MTEVPPGEPRRPVAVRLGLGGAAAATPARRLVLSPAEWGALVSGRLTNLPTAFAVAPVTGAEWDAAVASLVRRDVLLPAVGEDPAEPAPAVAVHLEVLRRPVLTVRLDVAGRGGARQGWFAVSSGLVAGVLTLPGGGVELSLAPDVRLGTELARAVPDASAVTGPSFPRGPAGTGAAPSGRLPLALLDDDLATPPEAVPTAHLDEGALADELRRRTAGSLSCLVLGRVGGSGGAGQVSWLATDAGWVGLRPLPDGSAGRLVEVVPVQPADLGVWLAPTVTALSGEAR